MLANSFLFVCCCCFLFPNGDMAENIWDSPHHTWYKSFRNLFLLQDPRITFMRAFLNTQCQLLKVLMSKQLLTSYPAATLSFIWRCVSVNLATFTLLSALFFISTNSWRKYAALQLPNSSPPQPSTFLPCTSLHQHHSTSSTGTGCWLWTCCRIIHYVFHSYMETWRTHTQVQMVL